MGSYALFDDSFMRLPQLLHDTNVGSTTLHIGSSRRTFSRRRCVQLLDARRDALELARAFEADEMSGQRSQRGFLT
jgi:hypothetical protein